MTNRPAFAIALAVSLAAASTAIAAGQQSAKPETKDDPNVITLSGCVSADARQKNVFTLSDGGDPTLYRLTGTNVRKYVGQKVEVSGVQPKGLKIVGGLYPSPNVAGQAGAIDPAKAAMAAQSEPGPGATKPMTEFRVKSVRVLPGSCEQK